MTVPAHLATGRCDAHDSQRMRRCEVLRIEGDRLTVRPVSGGEAFTRSVWSVRFVDKAKGRALRDAVRESVPRGEWTGCGARAESKQPEPAQNCARGFGRGEGRASGHERFLGQ